MKTLPWSSRSLAIALVGLALAVWSAHAQPVPINAGLDGNVCVGSVQAEDSSHNQFNVTATPLGVYADNVAGLTSAAPPGVMLASTLRQREKFERIYGPPRGRTIIGMSLKNFASGVYRLLAAQVGVVLDDGTDIALNLMNLGRQLVTATVLGTPSTGSPTSTWAKVIGDALYALGPSVYVSRDSGKTWTIDTTGLGGAFFRDIALDTLQNVYAATTKGLFKQPPDTSVWHKVTTFNNAASLVTVFVDRRNRIFVVGSGGGVFLSTDGGSSWNPDSTGIATLLLSKFADDNRGNIYATGGKGTVYKSVGGTGPWTRIDAGILAITGNPPAVNALAGDSLVVAATNFGLFVTSDRGNTWSEANNGILAQDFFGFARHSPDRMFISTDLGIFYKNAGDTSWHKSYPAQGYLGALPIFEDSAQTLFTVEPNSNPNSTALGPIYKSTDNGLTWKPDTLGLSATIGRVFFVDERGGEHIGSSFNGANIFARVYAQDAGRNWVLDTTGIPNGTNSFASAFGTDRAGLIYLSGVYAGTPRVLHRSIAGGKWTVDTVGLAASVHNFTSMRQGIVGEVFGTNGSSLYRHSAGVWHEVPLPSSSISKFTVDKGGTIFVVNTAVIGFTALDAGISMSTDNGATWKAITHDTIQVAALHSRGDTSYALLQGGGLYTLTRAGIVTGISTGQLSQTPLAYQLYQNYPNPFNPTTTITYSLPRRSHVSLVVFNVLGQKVAVLMNGEADAGSHSVQFNARNLASGVYFYRLETPGFVQTRRLVLIR